MGGLSELVLQQTQVMSLVDDETRKANQTLQEHQKKQETKLITGEEGKIRAISQGFTRKATVYLKNNTKGKYNVDAACTKIMIEGCNDCEIKLNARINTEMVELWNCENTTLICNANVKIVYTDKTHFGQIIWAGMNTLEIAIGNDTLSTGTETINRDEIADYKERFDQFIVRYVKGRLLQELVVRLDNGFPTTEREAAAFDEQKERNDKLYEAHVRKMISSKTTGISDKLDQLGKKEIVKVGRNDPCSCGSGKKFKKCCEGKSGLSEQEKQHIEDAKQAIKEAEEKAQAAKKELQDQANAIAKR